jgi:hypothetical protein
MIKSAKPLVGKIGETLAKWSGKTKYFSVEKPSTDSKEKDVGTPKPKKTPKENFKILRDLYPNYFENEAITSAYQEKFHSPENIKDPFKPCQVPENLQDFQTLQPRILGIWPKICLEHYSKQFFLSIINFSDPKNSDFLQRTTSPTFFINLHNLYTADPKLFDLNVQKYFSESQGGDPSAEVVNIQKYHQLCGPTHFYHPRAQKKAHNIGGLATDDQDFKIFTFNSNLDPKGALRHKFYVPRTVLGYRIWNPSQFFFIIDIDVSTSLSKQQGAKAKKIDKTMDKQTWKS